MTRRRPEQRANERQRAEHSAELHKALGVVMAHWPNIAEEADARPWPGNLRREGSGSGAVILVKDRGDKHAEAVPVTRVEALAFQPDAYSDWLLELIELGAMLRRLSARAVVLDPPRASNVGRENSVELCALCGDPAPKVKRVDDQPYCATSCYFKVWRTRRAASKA